MKTITVTQRLEDFGIIKPMPYAFRDWLQKLNRNDKLPSGKYFKGKVGGKSLLIMDEFWINTSNSTSIHSLHCVTKINTKSVREIQLEDAVTYIPIPTEEQKSLLDITQEKVYLWRKKTGNEVRHS
ncbi:hypothetical protein QMI71_004577 [Salmonella enterica]|nr:hypothetical protein [Salmonella enterica]